MKVIFEGDPERVLPIKEEPKCYKCDSTQKSAQLQFCPANQYFYCKCVRGQEEVKHIFRSDKEELECQHMAIKEIKK